MAGDLFRRDRPFHQLDDFYTEWSEHLTKHRLPLFHHFQPSEANNTAILRDLFSYYDTIDHYANKDTILYFLFPSWRSNSLETPILFLGDIHPLLFTTLIQSFIEDQDPCCTYSNLPEWRDLSLELEVTINATVSRLLGEMREAQNRFVKRFSDNWVSEFRSRNGTVVMETATSVTKEEDGEIMEELVRIFVEANQLRKDTITNVVGVLNINQMALFLESVCKFLAGFKHQDKAFEDSLFGNHLIIQQLPQNDQLLPPLNPPRRRHQYAPQVPPPDHVIYVGNLAQEATPALLLQMFSCYYHSVRGAKICLDKISGYKYGFVSFADEREKWHAMRAMHRRVFLNMPMLIGPAAKNSI